ncbi:unnamed protein product [Clonostachys rhizophaga]|uniref:Zn(2)-C6 fungal-type domain-containing protein n=1 Tax=Clonostachys rhizophaga TaxID=160324 RepID=A0A9N9VPM5_9HYPO|nr:unnamed protein product [Clonostachys rhizophaga]
MSSIQKPGGAKRRACVNCTVGKAKCSPHSNDICERCHRLGKECVYLNVADKRKSPGSNTTRRVKLLEKRVEGLVSLLTNPSLQSTASPDPLIQTSGPEPQPQQSIGTLREPQSQPYSIPSVSSVGVASLTQLTPPTSDAGSAWGTRPPDVVDRGLLSAEVAHETLQTFRNKAINHFPFVVLPHHANLHSVRRDTPFLFLCIMATMMVKDCTLQRQLGEEIRTQAYQRIMMGREKSMDLLQGLLVHVAWYQYQLQPQKQQMLLMTQLCVNLVYELGIEKCPRARSQNATAGILYPSDTQTTLCPIEVRALLGTYYLAATFTTKLKKRSLMPHTKFMKQASRWLSERREYPTDELIPYLVDMQELSRRIHDTFSFDNPGNIDSVAGSVTESMTKCYLAEIDSLQCSIPQVLMQNGKAHHIPPYRFVSSQRQTATLALEFPAIRAMIQESALFDELWCGSDASAARPASIFPAARTSLTWDSMQSYKLLIKGLVEYPNADAFYLTFSTFSKLCSVLSWLAKLVNIALGPPKSSADVPSDSSIAQSASHPWASMVAGDVELRNLVRQAQHKLNCMSADIASESAEPDSMTTFSILVGSALSVYDKQLQEYQRSSQQQAPAEPLLNQTIPAGAEVGEFPELYPVPPPDAATLDFFGNLMPQFWDDNAGFQLDAFQDMIWDRFLDDAILLP